MSTLWWSTLAYVLIPIGMLVFMFLSLPWGFLSSVRALVVRLFDSVGLWGMNLATVVFLGCSLCLWWEYQVRRIFPGSKDKHSLR